MSRIITRIYCNLNTILEKGHSKLLHLLSFLPFFLSHYFIEFFGYSISNKHLPIYLRISLLSSRLYISIIFHHLLRAITVKKIG